MSRSLQQFKPSASVKTPCASRAGRSRQELNRGRLADSNRSLSEVIDCANVMDMIMDRVAPADVRNFEEATGHKFLQADRNRYLMITKYFILRRAWFMRKIKEGYCFIFAGLSLHKLYNITAHMDRARKRFKKRRARRSASYQYEVQIDMCISKDGVILPWSNEIMAGSGMRCKGWRNDLSYSYDAVEIDIGVTVEEDLSIVLEYMSPNYRKDVSRKVHGINLYWLHFCSKFPEYRCWSYQEGVSLTRPAKVCQSRERCVCTMHAEQECERER